MEGWLSTDEIVEYAEVLDFLDLSDSNASSNDYDAVSLDDACL